MVKGGDDVRLAHPGGAEDRRNTFARLVREESAESELPQNEAAHRLRNVMSLVFSIVQQTRVTGRTATEYREVLMARLGTVMQFQQALPPSQPAPVDLRAFAAAQLSGISGNRLKFDDSPPVMLEHAPLRTLHLIFHELATNAIKYGALSRREGVVRLGWEVVPGETPGLTLRWREENGPPVRPPQHLGFGSKLIKASCPPAMGGRADLTYDPAGFRAEIVIPLG